MSMRRRTPQPVTLVLLILMMLAGATTTAADERQEPMDVIIALDKSLSMVEEIAAVKEYVNDVLVDKLLIPGDLFVVVAFYGKTEVPVARIIRGDADKAAIKRTIASIRADGRFTDIGNALDEVGRQLRLKGRPGVPKHLLLITDGKQEAPPGSRYWSPDGSFTHEFLQNTRTIQKEGWKVQVLAVGSEADARKLADKLAGIYTEVSDNPTAAEMTEKTRNFMGSIRMEGPPALSRVRRDGTARLRMRVRSQGYEEDQQISLRSVALQIPGASYADVLVGGPVSISVPASGTTETTLRLSIRPAPPPGRHTGTLQFVYATDERIRPTIVEVRVRANTFVQDHALLLSMGLALLLIGLVLLVVLRAGGDRGRRPISFTLHVQEHPLKPGSDRFTIRPDRDLFLQESHDMVRLSDKKTVRSLARLAAGEQGLALHILKPERFPGITVEPLPLSDTAVLLRSEGGADIHLRFTVSGPG